MELNETILAKLALADAVLAAIKESGLMKRARRARRKARKARVPRIRKPRAPRTPKAPTDGVVTAPAADGTAAAVDGTKPPTKVFRRSPEAAPEATA